MSRSHYVQADEADSINHNVQHMSTHELRELYGIQFIEDPDSKLGRVFDPVSNKEFATLAEWAANQVQEEAWSDMSHAHQTGHLFDDEYY